MNSDGHKLVERGYFIFLRDTLLHPKVLHIGLSVHIGLGHRYVVILLATSKNVLENVQSLAHITWH